jgi:hypothetical protein
MAVTVRKAEKAPIDALCNGVMVDAAEAEETTWTV